MCLKSLENFEASFPDPMYYCIGIKHPENLMKIKESPRSLKKQIHTIKSIYTKVTQATPTNISLDKELVLAFINK